MTHDDDDDGIHGYNILERSPSPSLPSELKKQKNSNTKNNSVSAIIVIDPIEKSERSRSPSLLSSSSSSRSRSFLSSGSSSSSSSIEGFGVSRELNRNRSNNMRRCSSTNCGNNNWRRNASIRSYHPGRGRKSGGNAERRHKNGREIKSDRSCSSRRSCDSRFCHHPLASRVHWIISIYHQKEKGSNRKIGSMVGYPLLFENLLN